MNYNNNKKIKTVNPATEEIIQEYEIMTKEQINDKVGKAQNTFTGSVPVGAKVAQRATSQLKKTVLELGGSDPFIVCEDADVEKASNGAVKGRFINCGQSCIASKRFFVVNGIADKFIEGFVQKTEKLRVGILFQTKLIWVL